jgi:predicted secreted protein
MTASAARIGFGARFGIKGSGSTYVYVAEVDSITPPSLSRDTVEVTHLESDDGFKEFIAGLADAGEASISIHYVPALSDALMTAFLAPVDDFRILFPSGTLALDFKGIVTGYAIGDLTAEGEMTATFTVKATGKPALVTVV